MYTPGNVPARLLAALASAHTIRAMLTSPKEGSRRVAGGRSITSGRSAIILAVATALVLFRVTGYTRLAQFPLVTSRSQAWIARHLFSDH